jgi:hypothetical protein
MGEENDPQNPPPPPTPTPPSGAHLTQEDLNSAACRARNEGRSSGQKELLDALGIPSVEEAKAKLKVLADIEEKNKDELTKAADRATKAESELNETKGKHQTLELDTRIQVAVLQELLGDDAKVLDRVRIIRRLIEVEGTADDKDIAAAVKELSKTMPELFPSLTGEGGSPPNGKPSGTPPPPGRPKPGGSKDGGDPRTLALTRLHERHPRTNPKN